MKETMPQPNIQDEKDTQEDYQERIVSPEAKEAYQKVKAGMEAREGKESAVEAAKVRVAEIIDQIEEKLKDNPFMTQSEEVASAFLHSTYALIAEGSTLVEELKRLGASETDTKRLSNKFDTFREEMAKGEDVLASRILKDAA